MLCDIHLYIFHLLVSAFRITSLRQAEAATGE